MKLYQREAKPRAYCCQTRQFYCFRAHYWLLKQQKTAVFFFPPWDLFVASMQAGSQISARIDARKGENSNVGGEGGEL